VPTPSFLEGSDRVAVAPTRQILLAWDKTDDRSAAAWPALRESFVNRELVVSDAA